jgi:hypothetical protein
MATPGRPAVLPVVTIFVTSTAALARAGGEDHRYVGGPLGRAEHLDAPGLLRGACRLDLAERQHLYALEPGFDFGPQDGTNFLVRGHQRPFDDAFGLARAGGAPRP